jgi:DNA-binding CsgD family transcriptional regulator
MLESTLSQQELTYIKLNLKKKSIADIARDLGTTYRIVHHAATKRMGYSSSHTFTEEEDKFIMENYGTLRVKKIAEILGISVSSVYNHSRMLGVRKFKK